MNYTVVWTKALLYSQRFVKSVCRQIDSVIEKRANIIPGITSGFSDFNDALDQTEKVIYFIEQKKRTLKLAVSCEDILEIMKPEYRKALCLKFKTFKTNKEIEKIMVCSLRTYFRHINEGIKAFTKLRERLNLSDEYLDNLYRQDRWILKLKTKASYEEDTKQKIVNVKLKNKNKLTA